MRAGTSGVMIKRLFDHDYSSILDSDAAISDYINTESDEYYYEVLANAIENQILQKFEDEQDIDIYVSVDASEQEKDMTINFSVYLEKPVILPVLLDDPEKSLTVKFDIDAIVKETIDCSLFIDSDETIDGDMYKAIKIRFDTFSIEVISQSYQESIDDSLILPDVVPDTVEVTYQNVVYKPEIRDVYLSAAIDWYLVNANEERSEDTPETVSYKDLFNGDCQWLSSTRCFLEFDFSMETKTIDAQPQDITNLKVEYSDDDLFDAYESDNVSIVENFE
jgi:hypothetical protein